MQYSISLLSALIFVISFVLPTLKSICSFLLCFCFFKFFLSFFFLNVYLFLRDRVRTGEGQREGETKDLKQAPGSELSAQSPTRGLTP